MHKTLLKFLGEFVDSFLIFKWRVARVNTGFKFSDPCHKYFWKENHEYWTRKTSIIPHCQKSLCIKLSDDRLFKELFRLACVGISKCFPSGLKLQRSQHFQKLEEDIRPLITTSHLTLKFVGTSLLHQRKIFKNVFHFLR